MKKQIKWLLMGSCLSMATGSIAQTYQIIGQTPSSGQNFNYSSTEANGYIVTSGTMYNVQTSELDINVTCRDANGVLMWNRIFDIGGEDFSGKVRPTPDGVMIVGTTGGLGDNYKEVFALHLDMSGSIISKGLYTPSTTGPTPNTYGFDVVYEPTDETFVFVGMGCYPMGGIDEQEDRFGWVMNTSYDLATINWNNYYTSDVNMHQGAWYDCINDIERFEVNNTPYYYLTGSLSDFHGDMHQQYQAVLNVMLNQNGSIAWDENFRGTPPVSGYINRQYDRGTNALYRGGNSFYLLYHHSWSHTCVLSEVDINSGNVMNSRIFFPLGGYEGIELNMQWEDANMTDIVVAGYRPGYDTYLFGGDPANLTTYNWQKRYYPGFGLADLHNINYDWILKPVINNANNMQRFFVPNMLSNIPISGSGMHHFMVSIYNKQAAGGGGPFANYHIQTDQVGDIAGADTCYEADTFYQHTDQDAYPTPDGWYDVFNFTYSEPNSAEADEYRYVTHCNMNDGSDWGIEEISDGGGDGGDGKNSLIVANNNTADNRMRIYPNPATDQTRVELIKAGNITQILVKDITGRTVFNTKPADSSPVYQLNISGFARGIYTLYATTNSGKQLVTRFVKQ